MEHDNPNAGQVKIAIDLPEEAQVGKINRETLWAEPEGGGLYRIYNVPLHAFNVHIGDLVRCAPGDPPTVEAVVDRSGAQTFRIYFSESATHDQIQEILHRMLSRQAILEKANDRVWAIGMRTVRDYEWAGPRLVNLQANGVLQFESGFQEDMPFAPPP